MLINLCSESVRTRSTEVDIGGSVREFLRRLNIDAGGKNMAQFQKTNAGAQLVPYDVGDDDGYGAGAGGGAPD